MCAIEGLMIFNWFWLHHLMILTTCVAIVETAMNCISAESRLTHWIVVLIEKDVGCARMSSHPTLTVE